MQKTKIKAGMNGFGRCGQHLLKYWVEKGSNANFTIDYINDPNLSIKNIHNILIHDQYLSPFYKSYFKFKNNKLLVNINNRIHIIEYTKRNDDRIPWIGKPKLFFECSGYNTNANNCKKFLKENTSLVIISATSPNADKTLIYGYNHNNFTKKDKIISYGSCTVNAYIPLTNYIHKKYCILDNDVNVIHNTPEYKLDNENTLLRKQCTLEMSAPRLLKFINKNNFKVNYTNVPYTGVSIIDFRYRLKTIPSVKDLIKDIESAIDSEELSNLYKIEFYDNGPEAHKFSLFSAIMIKTNIKIIGDNLYIQAYFDNENSVSRFYDLASYLANKIQ